MNDEGLNKSAILLMSIGEDEAAQVIKHLGPREVQKLGTAIAGLKNISKEKVQSVLDELSKVAKEKSSLVDTDSYLRSVLTKALGDDKAADLIERILHGNDTSGIEGLKWMDSASVAELVKNEHPQIIATILVHLDPDQASEILGCFPDRLRNEIILRVATFDGVQPAAMRELNTVLHKLLSSGSGNDAIKKKSIGGVEAAADILNFLGSAQEATVIESVKEFDADLAQKILDQMFVFDNLLELEDKSIQILLREIQSESLIVALKGASDELRSKVFKNMSQRAAEMLKEDLESKGPVRLSEVEAEQKEILKIVRRLAEEGQIIMGGKAEEAYV